MKAPILILALVIAVEATAFGANALNRVGGYNHRTTNSPTAAQSVTPRRQPPAAPVAPARAPIEGSGVPSEADVQAAQAAVGLPQPWQVFLSMFAGIAGLAFFVVVAVLWVLVPFLIWAQLNRLTSIKGALYRMEDRFHAMEADRVRVPCPQCGAPVDAVRGVTVVCSCGQHVRVEAT